MTHQPVHVVSQCSRLLYFLLYFTVLYISGTRCKLILSPTAVSFNAKIDITPFVPSLVSSAQKHNVLTSPCVRSFVRYQNCEYDIPKKNGILILLQIGTASPRSKDMKRSTIGVRRSQEAEYRFGGLTKASPLSTPLDRVHGNTVMI